MVLVTGCSRILIISVIALIACIATSLAKEQIEVQEPNKISVVLMRKEVAVGQPFDVKLTLQNAENELVSAPKNFPFVIELTNPSGDTDTKKLTIAAGTSSVATTVSATEAGIWSVLVKQPELMGGEAFILAKPRTMIGTQPQSEDSASVTKEANPPASMRLNEVYNVPANRGSYLTLRVTTESLRANGKDAATISAFFVSTSGLGREIDVKFFNSGGKLIPNPLVIPAGSHTGEATLTSDSVGLVKIEQIYSDPSYPLDGEKTLWVSFAPPVERYHLEASPPTVSLLNSSDLVATLLTSKDFSVRSGEDRKMSFKLEEGIGIISPKVETIKSNESEARVEFRPLWLGRVKVRATTPELLDQEVQVYVTVPYVVIGISLAGGLIGGLLAWFRHGDEWWRVVVGLFAGPAFYWVVVFGLLGFQDTIPRWAASNPFSAFFFALLGGWAGPVTLNAIVRGFGFANSPGHAN